MENHVSTVLSTARRYAEQATHHMQIAQTCIREISRLNKASRMIWKSMFDAHPYLYTWLYIALLVLDSAISVPLIRLITNEGQRLTNPLWDVVFFALYFVLVGAMTITAAEYFALKFSRRHWNLQVDLRMLFDKNKRRVEVEMELREEAARKYRIAVWLTVSLVVFLTVLCAFRVYVVNGHKWAFRPVDFIQLLPVGLAVLLIFLGRYKGTLLKKTQWSVERRRLVKKYHRARKEADHCTEVVIDQLQAAGIDWNDKSLPSEITHCIDYFRDKNPFELMEADPVGDTPTSAAG